MNYEQIIELQRRVIFCMQQQEKLQRRSLILLDQMNELDDLRRKLRWLGIKKDPATNVPPG